MLSIFQKTCCKCHESNSHQFIEFDTDHDPNIPGYVGPDGTIRGSPAHEGKSPNGFLVGTVLAFPGKGNHGLESDDTDVSDHLRQMEENELSKAWKEAEAMRNISYKIKDTDVDSTAAAKQKQAQPLHQEQVANRTPTKIDANSDGILTYDEFARGALKVGNAEKMSAYDSNPNLRNIQDELERTRALLGLPPRRNDEPPAVASNNMPPLPLNNNRVPSFGTQADHVPATPSYSARDTPPFSARYPNSDFSESMMSERQRHSDVPNSAREEQKQKIKDEVAALRARVRKAKTDILANQLTAGGNLRASPRPGSVSYDSSPRWGLLDPSPREESRATQATREESRATTGTYISADVSTF